MKSLLTGHNVPSEEESIREKEEKSLIEKRNRNKIKWTWIIASYFRVTRQADAVARDRYVIESEFISY